MTTSLFRKAEPHPGWRNVYQRNNTNDVLYGQFHVPTREALRDLESVTPKLYAIRVKHSKRFAEYLSVLDNLSVMLFGRDIFERYAPSAPAAGRAFRVAIDHGYVRVERNRYRLTDKGRDYINEAG